MTPKVEFPTKLVNHLPIRISIIGKEFSGKKFIAKSLNHSFGLEIINPDEIIAEAVALNKGEDGASEVRKPTKARLRDAKKKSKTHNTSKDEIEDVSLQYSQFKELGEKIMLLQENNEAIPDDLLVDLLIKKISCLFPNSTRRGVTETYLKLLDETQNRPLSSSDPTKDPKVKKDPKTAPKNAPKTSEEIPQKTLFDPAKYPFTQGFIFLNFPTTINQAILLDQQLTGFCPQAERLNPTAEALKVTARRLLKIKDLPQEVDAWPGMDLVAVIGCDSEICRARGKGRKRDPQTGEVYHAEYNPVPEGDKKLNDRLEEVEFDGMRFDQDQMNCEIKMRPFEEYYGQFGVEGKDGGVIKPWFKVENSDGEGEALMDILAARVTGILDCKYQMYQHHSENMECASGSGWQLGDNSPSKLQNADSVRSSHPENARNDTGSKTDRELNSKTPEKMLTKESLANDSKKESKEVLPTVPVQPSEILAHTDSIAETIGVVPSRNNTPGIGSSLDGVNP
jgi:hypothetical protein